nr:glycosyltransferase family A protein [uncultured Cohaesibacter sp.]
MQNSTSSEEQFIPSSTENLAIIIPVYNIPQDLSFLLYQVANLGIFSEVIVCDDASELDCNPEHLGFSEEILGARLVYLRSDIQRGAGHARNMGLSKVTARNILFFDADDHLNENLVEIWMRHIQGQTQDFTIFRHVDTRVRANEQREGSFKVDEAQWNLVLGHLDEKNLNQQESAHLCTISAYPWNKIYRTDFLISNGITCSETPVHNDIRLHWLSFARAKNILALRTIGADHVVGVSTHHLTNRTGEERLCLEKVLTELTAAIRQSPNRILFLRHYLHFVDTIVKWNLNIVDERLLDRFKQLAIKSYLSFSPEEFRIYALWQPQKASDIVNFIMKENRGHDA